MPTTSIIFTDAAGRDLDRPADRATFRALTPCEALFWAAKTVADVRGIEGAVVAGFRVEVAS